MSTYKGPHVSVIQEFGTSAPGVAVEDLPSVAVGTSYEVYDKELIDIHVGVGANNAPWTNITNSKPIIEGALSSKDYDFYPVEAFASTAFGDVSIDAAITEDNVTIEKDASFIVPGTEKDETTSTATIPYYNHTVADGIHVNASSTTTITIDGGYVISSGVVVGQRVFLDNTYVGVVESKPNTQGTIKISKPVTSGDYSSIVIGAELDGSNAPVDNAPNTIYDANSDFITAGIKIGDIVMFDTASKEDVSATITNIVNKNTLFFNTTSDAGDTDYYKYKKSDLVTSGSEIVVSYSVNRLVGFSKSNGNIGSVSTGTSSNKLVVTTSNLISVGDLIATGSTTQDNYTNTVISVIPGATGTFIVTVDGDIASVGDAYTWTPVVSSDVKVTFRAVNDASYMKVVRITNPNDISDNFGAITPYNELAFMLYTTYTTSGSKVVYGINVDSASDNIALEYTKATDVLKNLDVYSHAFGSTEPSIWSSIAPNYVDEESNPYNGHERIAICSHDEDDLISLGASVGTVTSETLLTVSDIDLNIAGVKLGDIVEISKDGDIGYYEVTATPSSASEVDIAIVSGFEFSTGDTVNTVFRSGSTSDQAEAISNVGTTNRRITNIFPGWFTASYNGERKLFPPYFIASAISGYDSGKIVSQSFTNYPIAIPGLTDYELNTSIRFNKRDLDTIGGGGVDLMIQDSAITQSFVSRHDLTSNMDAIEYRERSITKQVDVVAKTMRSAIAPYLGRYNVSDELLAFVRTIVTGVNRTLIKKSIVRDVTLVTLERDSDIADKINIVLSVTVFVAGNYYEITLNVKS